MKKRYFPVLLILAGFSLLLYLPALAWSSQSRLPVGQTVAAVTITPAATMQNPPGVGRLAPPPTVYPPAPADQGAQIYYMVCMACHGDRGQGLTAEFRQVIGPPGSNCWQSHCHGYDHPDYGFLLPRSVPSVVGPGVLDIFPTALQLHDFIHSKMPYQAPGSLKEEEYWQLTSYLLRANGIDPGTTPLDAQSASQISLGASPAQTAGDARSQLPVNGSRLIYWGAAGLGLLVLLLIAIMFRKR